MTMLPKVAIVDYKMGNVDSVKRAVEECGGLPILTSDPSIFETADRIILPGVGAFAAGMNNLITAGLIPVLREQIFFRKIPFLGICLGMQLLAQVGFEGGETAGLGWIPGEVHKLLPIDQERIPHVGWNEVNIQKESALFAGIPNSKDFYFVHSYHFLPSDKSMILAQTPYCGQFVSAVQSENIWGVQFHPEKSQKPGFQLFRNFLAS